MLTGNCGVLALLMSCLHAVCLNMNACACTQLHAYILSAGSSVYMQTMRLTPCIRKYARCNVTHTQ